MVNAQRVLDAGQFKDHFPQAEQAQLVVGLAVLEWLPLGLFESVLFVMGTPDGAVDMLAPCCHFDAVAAGGSGCPVGSGVDSDPASSWGVALFAVGWMVGAGPGRTGASSRAGDVTVAPGARARVAAEVGREPAGCRRVGTEGGRGSTRRRLLRQQVGSCRSPDGP